MIRDSSIFRSITQSLMMSVLFLLAGSIALPAQCAEYPPGHMSYVHWEFARKKVKSIEMVVNIANDPGDSVGLYFSPYNATIGNQMFYFGIQNLLWKEGCQPRKGILFSRWGTRDIANTKSTPEGWSVSMGNEGDFVSVRKFFDWKPGRYTLRIAPECRDSDGLWYEFTVTDDAGHTTSAGCLKFPLVAGNDPTLDGKGTAFMEFYCGAKSPAEVPFWKVEVERFTADDGAVPLVQAVSIYPHPHTYLKNADVYSDGSIIFMAIGRGVKRLHSPGAMLKRH